MQGNESRQRDRAQASDESALMSALAEPAESVDGAIVGETSRVTSPTDTLIVDLYRAILDVCVSILRQKAHESDSEFGHSPTDVGAVMFRGDEREHGCSFNRSCLSRVRTRVHIFGFELNLDECGFVKDIVSNLRGDSPEWTHLTDNKSSRCQTRCTLSPFRTQRIGASLKKLLHYFHVNALRRA